MFFSLKLPTDKKNSEAPIGASLIEMVILYAIIAYC